MQPVTGGLFDVDIENATGRIPVLTGASINMWEPDAGRPYAMVDEHILVEHLFRKAQRSARNKRSAYFGMHLRQPSDLPFFKARVAFKDVTSPTNTRSAIPCLVPPRVTLTHKAPFLLRRTGSERDESFVLGIMSSIPFDWYARRWVELSLSYGILRQMPLPRPAADNPIAVRITELSGRLAAVDDRFSVWAEAVGVSVGSLVSNGDRVDAFSELDALAAVLYGLTAKHITHIFETFHRGWDYSSRLGSVLAHYDDWKDQV